MIQTLLVALLALAAVIGIIIHVRGVLRGGGCSCCPKNSSCACNTPRDSSCQTDSHLPRKGA